MSSTATLAMGTCLVLAFVTIHGSNLTPTAVTFLTFPLSYICDAWGANGRISNEVIENYTGSFAMQSV